MAAFKLLALLPLAAAWAPRAARKQPPSTTHARTDRVSRPGSTLRMTTTMPDFKTAKSAEVFGEAKDLMPGGVSSPVRAFKSVGGEPVVFDRVKGSKAWDVDGNEYVDYVGTWGPAICGHANDEVNDELRKTLEKGTAQHPTAPV